MEPSRLISCDNFSSFFTRWPFGYDDSGWSIRKHGDERTGLVEEAHGECDRFMFENQVACDVTMVAVSLEGVCVSVPAHKYILVSRNHVFRAMLCGPLADGSNTINMTDISSEALVELLRHLYYREAHLSEDTVLELLHAASKYMIPSLAASCVQFITNNIDSDNVCMLLEYAHLYEEQDLIKKCLKYIQKCTAQVLNCDAFAGIGRETLQSILDQNSLSVEEDELLDAVLKWAQTRFNLKTDQGGRREGDEQELSGPRSPEKISLSSSFDDNTLNSVDSFEEPITKNSEINQNIFSMMNAFRASRSTGSSRRKNSLEILEESCPSLQLLPRNSVFSGLVEKIRVHSVTDSKLQDLLESENSLGVELGLRLYLRRSMEERVIHPRLEFPAGHVTCDVITTSSSTLVYSGRPCPPLLIETSEPITIHKILLLDRRHNNTSRVSISIVQNDVTLLLLDKLCAHCRQRHDTLGPTFAITLPGHGVRVEEGPFRIEARYSIAYRSYGTVEVGTPAAACQKFGVLDLKFPNASTATPVASLEVTVD